MQNHTRTVILRDSILGREEIQLLGRIIDENLDHDAREMIIWWAVVSSTDSFLNNSVACCAWLPGYALVDLHNSLEFQIRELKGP
jgi:hypothetical protein